MNKHSLPALPYEYSALEPYIDARTMEIHHAKHHQTYVDKLNAALENYPDLAGKTVGELVSNLDAIPEDIRSAVRNHGGGHFNHSFFWPLLTLDSSAPSGSLKDALIATFGDLESFKEQFTQAAASQFGSGWAWLSLTDENQLIVHSTPNQDNPVMIGWKPIIALDVWEHAYYLKYQNKRPDYIAAFWQIVNWEQAGQNFERAS